MSEREARVTQPTTEAGLALLEFAANIRPFGEDYPVLSPGSIERLTPLVVAIEREARADRPPEPPTPDVERLRADVAAMEHGWPLDDDGKPLGACGDGAETFRRMVLDYLAALGASPPPPDLSDLRARVMALHSMERPAEKGGATWTWVSRDAVLRLLASQPPSTPREP